MDTSHTAIEGIGGLNLWRGDFAPLKKHIKRGKHFTVKLLSSGSNEPTTF